jgi:hypothetical protein
LRRRRGLRRRSVAPEEAVGQEEFLTWVQGLEVAVKVHRNAKMKTFQHPISRLLGKRKRQMTNEVTEVAGPLDCIVCSCRYMTGTIACKSVSSDMFVGQYASPADSSTAYSCPYLYSDLMYNYFSTF